MQTSTILIVLAALVIIYHEELFRMVSYPVRTYRLARKYKRELQKYMEDARN